MVDLQAQRRWLLPAGAGVALALLAGKGGPVAILAAWLAQPAFALAVRGLRHQRKRVHLRRDALGLAVMWGTGLFVAAVVLAWPVMDEKDRIENPLGFQVSSYRVDNDYAPDPPLQEAPGMRAAVAADADGAARTQTAELARAPETPR